MNRVIRWIPHPIVTFGRMIFVVVLYAVWPLLRRIENPAMVFLVYGTANDQQAYWPSWLGRFLRPVFPVGFITFQGKWGFVAATPFTAEYLEVQEGAVETLLAAVRKEFPGDCMIALAGRLPSFAASRGIKLGKSFVDGVLGARCLVKLAVTKAVEQSALSPKLATVGVVGAAGFTGSRVVNDLAQFCGEVVAFDPSHLGKKGPRREGNVLFTWLVQDLGRPDIVVNLAPRGNDIRKMATNLKPEAYLLDDTHPGMRGSLPAELEDRGVMVRKAVMVHRDFRMFPRLPGFRPNCIPGCLLEALVVVSKGRDSTVSIEAFMMHVDHLGFAAALVQHTNDP